MSFQELGLSAPLVRAVASEGYASPTPIQTQAIPHLIAGRDLLGCAQTGTGKTAAFALPVLERLMHAPASPHPQRRPIRCLILSPTRELAVQIGDSVRTYGRHTGLRHTVVYGGVGQGPQTQSLRKGVDILVATPGRLVDLMQQGYVDLSRVEIFVLDEADHMLDMGFLPDLRRVLAKLPAKRQTALFSATIPQPIVAMAESILHHPVQVRVAPAQPTIDAIRQSVCFVPQQQKPQLLAAYLSSEAIERALVFTRTKHGADRVVRKLGAAGIHASAIHGNKSQSVRQRTLDNFKSSHTRILIATDIAARGIDVDGISHVLNYDLPHEPETYVHRIGRTGRAGASGIAVSFCDGAERKLLKSIERLIRKSLPVMPSLLSEATRQTQDEAPVHRGKRKRISKPHITNGHGTNGHSAPKHDGGHASPKDAATRKRRALRRRRRRKFSRA